MTDCTYDTWLVNNMKWRQVMALGSNGEQEWCSGESTCLSPTWPGFSSSSVSYELSLSLVLASLLQWFFLGFFSFPLSAERNTPNSDSTRAEDLRENQQGWCGFISKYCIYYHGLRYQQSFLSSFLFIQLDVPLFGTFLKLTSFPFH